ncbi:hypothetical protein [Myroides sp. WP-1]|uniref:hypothetical protein n=1 Tax=Myroides sp. WP-1 TaxID=2759944 RepID=UPI0015FE4C01|nr:hypothetical protein [Myroides sp. WP-1]MBB1140540.1 hypothetical protein [Myroides sp. WP-1]
MKKSKIFIFLSGLLVIVSFLLVQNVIVKNKFNFNSADEKLLFDDVNRVKNIINDRSAYPVMLNIRKDKTMLIEYEDHVIFDFAKDNIDAKSFKKIKNSSYKSALYSLGFLRNYMIENGIEGIDVEQVDKLVDEVIDLAQSFVVYDVYINHDHPVAERLESLVLYISLKKAAGYVVSNKEVNHVKHLVDLLMEKDFFSYHMNHGLMQIRALLRVGTIVQKQEIIDRAKEYLFDVLPIYVSEDGSILESAFGYQYYIFLQFDLFNTILGYNDDHTLRETVEKQKRYLNSIVSTTGFLQGTGDSYNQNIDTTLIANNSKGYNIFQFENNVAGLSSENKDFMMFFVSLDNKPNVHKLQEDLGVYLYYKRPYIINSGTYSYEVNDEFRKIVLGPTIQNGPKFKEETITSSEIKSVNIEENEVSFLGHAQSVSNEIDRKVVFRDKHVIDVFDSSESNFTSSFIIHPEIKVEAIDKFMVKLIAEEDQIVVQSLKPIYMDTIFVSDSYKSKVQTIKLSTKDTNQFSFYLPDNFEIDLTTLSSKLKHGNSERYNVMKELKHKYPVTLVVRKVFVSYILLAGTFVLASLAFLLRRLFFTYLYLLFNLFLLCNLFTSGKLIIYIVYFINSLK